MDVNCVTTSTTTTTSSHDDHRIEYLRKTSTRSDIIQPPKFVRSASYYDSFLDAKLSASRNRKLNATQLTSSRTEEFHLRQKYFGNGEIIQYYDDEDVPPMSQSQLLHRPQLRTSKSLYYLPMRKEAELDVAEEEENGYVQTSPDTNRLCSRFNDDNCTGSEEPDSEHSPPVQTKLVYLRYHSDCTTGNGAPPPLNLDNFYYRRSIKHGSSNGLRGPGNNLPNSVISSDRSENIKNLSQFLVQSKTRSRSQSPRSSFKNRGSQRKPLNSKNKHASSGKKDKKDANGLTALETELETNGSISSSHSGRSTTVLFGDTSSYATSVSTSNGSSAFVPKVGSDHIKENLGLLSSSQLKKNVESAYIQSELPEEEPAFNAFDIKSLRYSFNKVLKRRGGLWSFSPPPTGEYPNCALINVRERAQKQGMQRVDREEADQQHKQRLQDNEDVSILELIGECQKLFWCEVPRVQRSGLLESLDASARQFQEASFELITSEASYLRSLNVLIKNFYRHTSFCDPEIIDQRKKEELFSNISEVIAVSSQLLIEMEARWKQNIYVPTFCDILLRFAEQHFEVYQHYCRFKRRQECTLRQLKEKPKFNGILRLLETDSKCQGLSLHSFLLLPVQRITRYPLLVEAVLRRLQSSDPTYAITRECLHRCHHVVNSCNFAAKQYEEYENLIPKLKFNNIKLAPLSLLPRWLLGMYEVAKLKGEAQASLMGSFRSTHWSKTVIVLILFSDLVVLAKKKSDDCYIVIDFCNANCTQMTDPCASSDLTNGQKANDPQFKNLIKLVFRCNFANKKIDYVLNFSSEADKEDWIRHFSSIERKIAQEQQVSVDLNDIQSTFALSKDTNLDSKSIATTASTCSSSNQDLQHVTSESTNREISSTEVQWEDSECTNEIFI